MDGLPVLAVGVGAHLWVEALEGHSRDVDAAPHGHCEEMEYKELASTCDKQSDTKVQLHPTLAIFREAGGQHTAGVAVLANDPAVAAGRVEVELFAHEVAETGRVQVGAGADDAVAREAAQLPGHVGQNVDWKEQNEFLKSMTCAAHHVTV